MSRQRISAWIAVVCLLGTGSLCAQSGSGGSADSGASASVVPRLIKFSGEINPAPSGITQITQIKESEGGKSQLPTVVSVTISEAYGLSALLSNASTGTITNRYGMYVQAPENSGGGKFSNYTGLYIANPTAAVPGAYGVYSAG